MLDATSSQPQFNPRATSPTTLSSCFSIGVRNPRQADGPFFSLLAVVAVTLLQQPC